VVAFLCFRLKEKILLSFCVINPWPLRNLYSELYLCYHGLPWSTWTISSALDWMPLRYSIRMHCWYEPPSYKWEKVWKTGVCLCAWFVCHRWHVVWCEAVRNTWWKKYEWLKFKVEGFITVRINVLSIRFFNDCVVFLRRNSPFANSHSIEQNLVPFFFRSCSKQMSEVRLDALSNDPKIPT